MENKIISVERILQYTLVPSEPPLLIEDHRPDRSWPSHGEIDIQDLQVNLNLKIPPKIWLESLLSNNVLFLMWLLMFFNANRLDMLRICHSF